MGVGRAVCVRREEYLDTSSGNVGVAVLESRLEADGDVVDILDMGFFDDEVLAVVFRRREEGECVRQCAGIPWVGLSGKLIEIRGQVEPILEHCDMMIWGSNQADTRSEQWLI